MAIVRKQKMKLRFAGVGAIATTIDFALLFGISSFGFPFIGANFISTTSAFCFSFFANRHYTFKSTDGHLGKQIALYVSATLFGIWVLQPPVIFLVQHFLDTHIHVSQTVLELISKFAATGVTLVWNYYLYSRVVFKKPTADNHPEVE